MYPHDIFQLLAQVKNFGIILVYQVTHRAVDPCNSAVPATTVEPSCQPQVPAHAGFEWQATQ